MAAAFGFPDSVGPFLTTPCRIAPGINAFYRQNEFPKPDPASDEPSMAGVDPQAAGMGIGDILFCQLSPLYQITLDAETKAAANIPGTATHFAWCYPAVGAEMIPGSSAEAMFLKLGGYLYFDSSRSAVGANAIQPAALGTLALMFGRAQPLPAATEEMLTKQGRFQDVTLDALTVHGATHFAWIRPQEFNTQVAAPDGAFSYKFAGGGAKYFPVVGTPIFTPEMLEEELDDTEAWVVVRIGEPQVERVVMFNKEADFNTNTTQQKLEGLAQANDDQVTCTLGQQVDIPYSEWKATQSSGSIADPWILTVRLQ